MSVTNQDIAGVLDMVCNRGNTFQLALQFQDETINTSSFKMQVKGSGTIALDLSTDNGKLTINNNTLSINVSAADMLSLKATTYNYDLVQTTGDVKQIRLRGRFIVNPLITEA
jgi:hypothetical protein